MAWANEEIARQFAEIALLLKLKGSDTFKVRAYERAATAIGSAPLDVAELTLEEVGQLQGIGKSTLGCIAEYRESGTMQMLERLRADVPPGFSELVRIPGLGPKKVKLLHDELGIDSVDTLRSAIDAGELRGLKGLGAKTEENLREALTRVGAKDSDRTPVGQALSMAEQLCARLAELPEVVDVCHAGSLRRMRETVGDIDILVASDDPAPVMEAFRTGGLAVKVLAAGEKKTSILTVRGQQADLRVVEPAAWGAALQYFTGSKEHNVRVRERAVRRGLMLNEYGLFERVETVGDDGEVTAVTGQRRASRTEADVYAALDLEWIPPTMREDRGEVEAAADGRLPKVVTVDDIRGDLHFHTDWSGDGKVSMERMLTAAAERGYAYVAVTDHAEDLTMNGLSRERMLAQRQEIVRLQEQFPTLRILHGAELNIGIDGSLDYDEEFLLGYEFTVASVHSHFPRPEPEQTARIITAMQHPAVTVIGHPTGRKIGRRPGYDIDIDAVVEAAVLTGTALEVNASPARLDLSGEHVRKAVEAGAKLAISCDAHALGDLDNMRYGVATAQRGWATPADVLNCRDLDGLLEFVAAKRRAAGVSTD